MKILEFIPKHWREQATGVTEGFVLALAKPLQTAWDIRKRLDLWLSPENMDSSTLDFWLYFLGLPPSVILVLNQGQKISLLPNLVNTWVSKGSVEGVELYAKAIFGPSIVFSEDASLFIVGVSKAGFSWDSKTVVELQIVDTFGSATNRRRSKTNNGIFRADVLSLHNRKGVNENHIC